MNYRFLLLVFGMFCTIGAEAQKRIVVEGLLHRDFKGDSAEIEFAPIDYIGIAPEWKKVKGRVINNTSRIDIYSDKPIITYSSSFFGKRNSPIVFEPGDSVNVSIDDAKIYFSGRGSEKLRMLYVWESGKGNLTKPVANSSAFSTTSIADYLQWNVYLNKQLRILEAATDSFSAKISPFAYNYIKANCVAEIEYIRIFKFWELKAKANEFGLTGNDLVNIFDSTLSGPSSRWIRSMSADVDNVLYFQAFNMAEILRGYKFNVSGNSVISDTERRLLYYPTAKLRYKGLVREKLLAFILTYKIIKDLGFTPETEAMLKDYYSQPGYREYKGWVKEYEEKARVLTNGQQAPDFRLSAENGKYFSKDSLAGKVALIDFWFSGCVGCAEVTPILKEVEDRFGNDKGVAFVNVSIDRKKEKWMKSIVQGKYTTGRGINLYTEGQGENHKMIKDYNVISYPSLVLLDANGRIVQDPSLRLSRTNGEDLAALIAKQLVLMHDGPYVWRKGDSIEMHSLYGHSVIDVKGNVDRNALPRFLVQTDQRNKQFEVVLKSSLSPEPPEYSMPEKMYVLSDIEGNFEALRELLQAGGVVDDNLNWTFGNGHLVLNGDLFDRGEQVTEVLWFIYSLEEKARSQGGYVHFILGNHEVMNLNGDSRYVNDKYQFNARRLGAAYSDLYKEGTELGNWLRTKNIMEKIGDMLFVHGGISKEIRGLPLSIGQINELARKYIDKDNIARKTGSNALATIFDDKLSPFWYRLYYLDKERKIYSSDTLYKTPLSEIDYTLKRFGVNHIVTGHTIVSDTISFHYEGKVINVDTHHASGKSEALLVDDGKFFSVSSLGKRQVYVQNRILVAQRAFQKIGY